ncbi:hypothetical protein C8Q78DRAFT_739266 [Trametes maxima]|nr:hypothetical protein C8Q78DRAFT_739266 [Trametes maxima]
MLHNLPHLAFARSLAHLILVVVCLEARPLRVWHPDTLPVRTHSRLPSTLPSHGWHTLSFTMYGISIIAGGVTCYVIPHTYTLLSTPQLRIAC